MPSPISPQSVAARAPVEVALAGEGHSMLVQARCGLVTITINKHVLLLKRLEDDETLLIQSGTDGSSASRTSQR